MSPTSPVISIPIGPPLTFPSLPLYLDITIEILTIISFAITATVAGLFPVASRFNHACHPSQNIGFSFDQHKGLLILWVRAEHVAVGEELKISYRTNHTPEDLYHLYGFLCQCGTCSGINEEQAIMIRSQW